MQEGKCWLAKKEQGHVCPVPIKQAQGSHFTRETPFCGKIANAEDSAMGMLPAMRAALRCMNSLVLAPAFPTSLSMVFAIISVRATV